jgi:putative membrane protein
VNARHETFLLLPPLNEYRPNKKGYSMRFLGSTAVALLLIAAPAVSSAQEAAQPPAASSASVDASSVDSFAQAAAQSSLSEVLMSAMALQKTNDKRVEENAWTMLDHHARAMGDLAEALGPDAASLPTEPSAEQTAMLEEMKGMDGEAFDQAYFKHQVEAHTKGVSVFEQGQTLSDEKVAAYARTTLPILKAHLEIVQIRQKQAPQPMPAQ